MYCTKQQQVQRGMDELRILHSLRKQGTHGCKLERNPIMQRLGQVQKQHRCAIRTLCNLCMTTRASGSDRDKVQYWEVSLLLHFAVQAGSPCYFGFYSTTTCTAQAFVFNLDVDVFANDEQPKASNKRFQAPAEICFEISASHLSQNKDGSWH